MEMTEGMQASFYKDIYVFKYIERDRKTGQR